MLGFNSFGIGRALLVLFGQMRGALAAPGGTWSRSGNRAIDVTPRWDARSLTDLDDVDSSDLLLVAQALAVAGRFVTQRRSQT